MENGDEIGFRCRKHPTWRRNGACAYCLRDRLIRLCPDCARVRPCTCSYSTVIAATSSISSSSSSSSFSSSSDFAPHRRLGGLGYAGRVGQLLESEPAFQRSRSAAFSFLRRGSGGVSATTAPPLPEKKIGYWFFSKVPENTEAVRAAVVVERLGKSRSVNMDRSGLPESDRRGHGRDEKKAKKWGFWNFPSPMKVFVKHQKKSSPVKLVHERSPICRG